MACLSNNRGKQGKKVEKEIWDLTASKQKGKIFSKREIKNVHIQDFPVKPSSSPLLAISLVKRPENIIKGSKKRNKPKPITKKTIETSSHFLHIFNLDGKVPVVEPNSNFTIVLKEALGAKDSQATIEVIV